MFFCLQKGRLVCLQLSLFSLARLSFTLWLSAFLLAANRRGFMKKLPRPKERQRPFCWPVVIWKCCHQCSLCRSMRRGCMSQPMIYRMQWSAAGAELQARAPRDTWGSAGPVSAERLVTYLLHTTTISS